MTVMMAKNLFIYSLMENYILWLGNVIINSFPNKSLKKIMVFYIEDKSKNEGVLLPGLITWTDYLDCRAQSRISGKTARRNISCCIPGFYKWKNRGFNVYTSNVKGKYFICT
jgi:hypothetical protein